jgi:TolB-like protein
VRHAALQAHRKHRGYALEGSVRKAANQLRVSAQLVDAVTGHHVWAERYDRELAGIFALQDEITERVVAAVEPQLYAAGDRQNIIEGFRLAGLE